MTGLHRACCCVSEPCGGCDWSVLQFSWNGTLRFEAHLCECPDPNPTADLYELDVTLRNVSAQFTGTESFGVCSWTGETVTFTWDYTPCSDEPALDFELRCQVSILHVGAGVWQVFVDFSYYDAVAVTWVTVASHTYESDDVGTSECPYVGTYSQVDADVFVTPATWPCPEDPNHWLAKLTDASYPSTITLNV